MPFRRLRSKWEKRRIFLRKKEPAVGEHIKPKWLPDIYRGMDGKLAVLSVSDFFKGYPKLAELRFGTGTFRDLIERTAEMHRKRLGSEFDAREIEFSLVKCFTEDEYIAVVSQSPLGDDMLAMVDAIERDPARKRRFLRILLGKTHYPNVITLKRRYANVDSFLKEHGVKSLLDVGCAASMGAPTTATTKEKLGKEARVVGIDATAYKDKKQTPEQKGIEFVRHKILEVPFPEKFGAVRIGFFHQYLPKAERKRLFKHSMQSLEEGGYIIVAPSHHRELQRGGIYRPGADIYQLKRGKLQLVTFVEVYNPPSLDIFK